MARCVARCAGMSLDAALVVHLMAGRIAGRTGFALYRPLVLHFVARRPVRALGEGQSGRGREQARGSKHDDFADHYEVSRIVGLAAAHRREREGIRAGSALRPPLAATSYRPILRVAPAPPAAVIF